MPLAFALNRRALDSWAEKSGGRALALADAGSMGSLGLELAQLAGSIGTWRTRRLPRDRSPLAAWLTLTLATLGFILSRPPRLSRSIKERS